MEDKKLKSSPSGSPLGDLKWVLFILVILWFVWFFTGGPQRYESKKGIYIKPADPVDTGEVYGPQI